MSTTLRLENKVIILTGGGNGLGKVYCKHLAEEGAHIAIADIDIDAANEVAAQLNSIRSNTAIAIKTDVTSESDTLEMAKKTKEHFGQIDILINNAGSYPHEEFSSITYDRWKKIISVNLDSVFLCSRAVLDHMKEQESGKIINISTDLVWIGLPCMVHYVSAKAGIIGFTRSLAREIGEYNISVNAITPGAVADTTDYNLENLRKVESIVSHQSLKWCQRPIDLVGPLKFLCSSESDFISGQILNVDGGLTNH